MAKKLLTATSDEPTIAQARSWISRCLDAASLLVAGIVSQDTSKAGTVLPDSKTVHLALAPFGAGSLAVDAETPSMPPRLFRVFQPSAEGIRDDKDRGLKAESSDGLAWLQIAPPTADLTINSTMGYILALIDAILEIRWPHRIVQTETGKSKGANRYSIDPTRKALRALMFDKEAETWRPSITTPAAVLATQIGAPPASVLNITLKGAAPKRKAYTCGIPEHPQLMVAADKAAPLCGSCIRAAYAVNLARINEYNTDVAEGKAPAELPALVYQTAAVLADVLTFAAMAEVVKATKDETKDETTVLPTSAPAPQPGVNA